MPYFPERIRFMCGFNRDSKYNKRKNRGEDVEFTIFRFYFLYKRKVGDRQSTLLATP